MKKRFRKTFVSRSRLVVFVAEPPTQPPAGMHIDRTVGRANWTQTEVVGPTDYHAVELFHHHLRIQPNCVASGLIADSSTDALHPFFGWDRAEIDSAPPYRVTPPERVSQKVKLLFRQITTRVFLSFTVSFSFDIIVRIATRACSAPTRQQMTRSSA